ncbi:MAG: dihydrofolate reductase [Candidatus Omnitrophica bacterium]|nr:dihydrofolate reductase [Candidatus Omnitrophota bacterium]
MLYQVVAVAKNHVIGKSGELPWDFGVIPAYFKEIVSGGTLILGRKTWEGVGRSFPQGACFVLSKTCFGDDRDPRYFESLGEALNAVRTKDIFIGGGGDLYRQTVAFVDGIHCVRIDKDYDGDVFYPPVPGSFVERSRVLLQRRPRIEGFFYESKPAAKCCCRAKEQKP